MKPPRRMRRIACRYQFTSEGVPWISTCVVPSGDLSIQPFFVSSARQPCRSACRTSSAGFTLATNY